ncbi:MAG: hypothetical protein ACOC32_04865 [Nanoarchaeota archaeon]
MVEPKYYPDSLRLDENVIASSRFLFIYYYVTDKRLLRENKLSKKTYEVPVERVSDSYPEQNRIESLLKRGRITLVHSNHKKDVPIMRRKYFVMKNVKHPEETYAAMQRVLQR